jgi:hypothetical protein
MNPGASNAGTQTNPGASNAGTQTNPGASNAGTQTNLGASNAGSWMNPRASGRHWRCSMRWSACRSGSRAPSRGRCTCMTVHGQAGCTPCGRKVNLASVPAHRLPGGEVLVYESDRHAAFAHRGCHALYRSVPHVARREHARDGCLQEVAVAVRRFRLGAALMYCLVRELIACK